MKKTIMFAVFIGMVLLGGTVAMAVPIYGDMSGSAENLADFTGDMSYDPALGQLTVMLTNTTPAPATTSYITALLFNNPDNAIGGAALTSAPEHFVLITKAQELNAAPYGSFDFGAKLTNGAGVNTADGIGVGQTGTFVFTFTGSGLAGLTTQDFIEELSAGATGYADDAFILVRFQAIDTGAGSDKVPGETSDNPVPEPATMLLLGPALAGLALARKKA